MAEKHNISDGANKCAKKSKHKQRTYDKGKYERRHGTDPATSPSGGLFEKSSKLFLTQPSLLPDYKTARDPACTIILNFFLL